MVMSQMQIAGVKPDSETFSYLILNCESEESNRALLRFATTQIICYCHCLLLCCGSWKGTSLGSGELCLSKNDLV